MSTQIRPEVSKKSTYWISRHRYYELKHFVMQYPEWFRERNTIDSIATASYREGIQSSDTSDPIWKAIERRDELNKKIDICQSASYEADPIAGKYILTAVIENISYDKINAKYVMTCSKDQWYEIYRKFFYILDKKRN